MQALLPRVYVSGGRGAPGGGGGGGGGGSGGCTGSPSWLLLGMEAAHSLLSGALSWAQHALLGIRRHRARRPGPVALATPEAAAACLMLHLPAAPCPSPRPCRAPRHDAGRGHVCARLPQRGRARHTHARRGLGPAADGGARHLWGALKVLCASCPIQRAACAVGEVQAVSVLCGWQTCAPCASTQSPALRTHQLYTYTHSRSAAPSTTQPVLLPPAGHGHGAARHLNQLVRGVELLDTCGSKWP